jgi:hypothetical protein
MPASPTPLRRQPTAHPHALPSQCPYCDQPIPEGQAEEIRHRIEARERDQAEKLSREIRQDWRRKRPKGRRLSGQKSSALRRRTQLCRSP